MTNHPRRSFLKAVPLAAAGWACGALASKGQNDRSRLLKNGMHYRRLGRTGLFISEISLGGSPLPDWSLLMQIIERGVNYIDTSESYNNGNSERQIGRLLKTVGRDKLYVGTKFHLQGNFSEQTILRSAEGSLQRLGTDFVDVLLIHGASDPDHLTDGRVLAAFDRLKKEGKCRFTGLSCHENQAAVVGRAVACGLYDMVQVATNVFDLQGPERATESTPEGLRRNGLSDLLGEAAKKDMGVIAMKTLKVGGRRQDLAEFSAGSASLQQAMLKYVLENRNVTSAVTEMMNAEEMEQDLAVAGAPLTAEERRMLYRLVVLKSRLVCRACGVCRNECPEDIPVPGILRALAYWESYGKFERAKATWREIGAGPALAHCRDCGACEAACPYRVAVRRRFGAARALLPA